MAEGFARHLKGDRFDVHSAGIEKHGLNPFAVQAMDEAGIDIGGHTSKTLAELPTDAFDFVVTVCGHADETCPHFPARTHRIHVGFDDPPRLAADEPTAEAKMRHYRRVRDEIRQFVEHLEDALQIGP